MSPPAAGKPGRSFCSCFLFFGQPPVQRSPKERKKEKELTDHASSTPSDRIEEEQEEVEPREGSS